MTLARSRTLFLWFFLSCSSHPPPHAATRSFFLSSRNQGFFETRACSAPPRHVLYPSSSLPCTSFLNMFECFLTGGSYPPYPPLPAFPPPPSFSVFRPPIGIRLGSRAQILTPNFPAQPPFSPLAYPFFPFSVLRSSFRCYVLRLCSICGLLVFL